ncbi:MAG: 2-amino-4-hydroxy-6-hydroxymethyldihydropteridine diphosphokinase [Bacteroidota bacterium]
MSRHIYIGLGSNVGDRLGYLDSAVKELSELSATKVVGMSSVYETEPYGNKDQPEFLNMAVELESSMDLDELFSGLKSIEAKLGRHRTERWGPREIDLDLLYYGKHVVNQKKLQVPHPEVGHRRFVLVPLNEIAHFFIDPVRRKNISELLAECSDSGVVRKTELTTRLQEH